MSSVSVLPDGRVVSGSYDNTVRIWKLSSGGWKCEAILKGHTSVKNMYIYNNINRLFCSYYYYYYYFSLCLLFMFYLMVVLLVGHMIRQSEYGNYPLECGSVRRY